MSASDFELARPAEANVWRATGREEPVFLDRSGRRRPLLRVCGALLAAGSAAWLGALVTGAIGFGSLPATSISGVLPAVRDPAVGRIVALTRPAPERSVHAPALGAHRRLAADVDGARHHRRNVDRVIRV